MFLFKALILSICTKIIEFVERSKEWSSVEASSETAQNVMTGVTEEELYNMPTAEYVNRRGFLNRPLTVYHVAFQACADLRNVEVLFYISIISVQLFYKNQSVLCTCLVFLVVRLVALLILVITFSVSGNTCTYAY